MGKQNDTGTSAEVDHDGSESNEDDGTESNEDGEKYVGKKHKALQRGDEKDDRSSANDDDKMEDGSESKSDAGSDSKAASEASGDESADAEPGDIEVTGHKLRDDQAQDVEVRPEVDNVDEVKAAERKGPTIAD